MAQKKGNRIFVWIIMGLLFIGLLGFGTGGLSGNVRSIGSAGDKDISVSLYQQNLTQQIRAFEAQIGNRIGFQEAQQIGLDQAALASVVSARVLDNEASNLGVSVGDERIREEVLGIPAFRGLDGQFDREAYRQGLQRIGQSERDFEDSMRDEIARTLLQGAVVGGIPAPAPYADAIVQFLGETRSVTLSEITAEALDQPVPGPTDADIQAFYDENPERFTQPEQREISYAWLTPDMIQDQLEVDEDAVRALYDERTADFIRPERRLVERLVFIEEAAAQAAADRINAGEIDFDALVAERGLDLADIDLGDVSQTDLGAAGEAVFAAQPGDVVGPHNSTIGPALFRMNAVLAAEEVTFDEAAPDLRAELAADRARRVIEGAAEGMNDLLAGGASVADLAAQTDMVAGKITWDEATRSDIAAYENFRTAAATAEEGAFPELMNLSDGGIFVLELDAVIPPTVKPLAEVADDAREGWMDAKAQELLLAYAEGLAAEVQPLTTFNTLGLAPRVENDLTRTSFVAGTPPTFMTEVFEMAVGDARVIDNGTGVILVRLDTVTPAVDDDPTVAAQREQIGQQVAAGIAQDIFAAFSAEVQSRTDVTIDQTVINALHAQFQ